MIATMGLNDVRIDAVMGVYEEERGSPRPLSVDLEMDYVIDRIAASDEIGDGIDYDRVVAMVREHVVWQKYRTLEALVAGVAEMLTTAYPLLERLRVTVRKPDSAENAKESWVSVQIGRRFSF